MWSSGVRSPEAPGRTGERNSRPAQRLRRSPWSSSRQSASPTVRPRNVPLLRGPQGSVPLVRRARSIDAIAHGSRIDRGGLRPFLARTSSAWVCTGRGRTSAPGHPVARWHHVTELGVCVAARGRLLRRGHHGGAAGQGDCTRPDLIVNQILFGEESRLSAVAPVLLARVERAASTARTPRPAGESAGCRINGKRSWSTAPRRRPDSGAPAPDLQGEALPHPCRVGSAPRVHFPGGACHAEEGSGPAVPRGGERARHPQPVSEVDPACVLWVAVRPPCPSDICA